MYDFTLTKRIHKILFHHNILGIVSGDFNKWLETENIFSSYVVYAGGGDDNTWKNFNFCAEVVHFIEDNKKKSEIIMQL